ncbi:MAG: hypothetical protein KDC84_15830, partial [Crocinitomicaceae bacterium]|nr:hypothetical protein [Crocinitomicaceae bacterium]
APVLESKHTFKMNGDWWILYEDASVLIELRKLNDYGSMEYKVTNKGAQDLKMNNNVPIGEVTISNSHREEIYLMKKNNFAMQKLAGNASYTYKFNAQLNPISGEYWVDNHKLVGRKTYPRDYVPTNLKLRKIQGAALAVSTGGTGNTKVYILYPLNSLSKYDMGKFYFKDAQKHLMRKGQVYQVNLSATGLTKWITFDSEFNGYTYPPDKINKWLGDKPGIMKDRVTSIDAQPGQAYYYVMVGDGYLKLQSVTKEEWNKYLKDRNMVSSSKPEVISK